MLAGSLTPRSREGLTVTAVDAPPAPTPPKPLDLVKSKQYVVLLLFGALVGVPVAAIAYYYLKLVTQGQKYFFTTLPGELGFHGAPVWWPLPMLALCGLIVGVTLRYLPGTGGHNPADGFAMGGDFTAKDLPSVLIASLATLIFGGVLGPEMPLVVIGMVVATTIVRLIKKDAPKQAVVIIGAAGSFAAISTLLGSPVVGAFLLLEAAGVGGGLISVILLPGLVASGVGALVFVALSHATGTGVATLAVPHLPAIGYPTGSQFGWAIGIGLLAAPAGTAIRRLAFQIQPFVARHKVLVTPVAGLAVGGLAVLFAEETGKSSHFVLFSGQSDLAPLIQHAATWFGRSPGLAHRLQRARLRRIHGQLQRRPGLPRYVSRRRDRHRPVPPSRPAAGRRRGHGNRGDDRGCGRWSPAVIRGPDAGLHSIRCLRSDIGGDHCRRRGVRRFRMARAVAETSIHFT